MESFNPRVVPPFAKDLEMDRETSECLVSDGFQSSGTLGGITDDVKDHGCKLHY